MNTNEKNLYSENETKPVDQVPEDYGKLEGLEDSVMDLGEYPIDSVLIRNESRTVFDVIRRIKQKQFILDPDFQRDFVWDSVQQSRLIESTLMRIPLPVFYLAEQEDGRIVVVDGLQRLTTFYRFLENEFPLKGMHKTNAELNGRRFRDLIPKFQSRIEDTQLILYLIDSKVPERARLDIFERVNSGEPLTRQQMRNCLYVGKATIWLRKQSQSELFKQATGGSLNSKTMRDRELINRFCGFKLLGTEKYKGDMDSFLAETLKHMNLLDDAEFEKLEKAFEKSMANNYEVFRQHAFRKHTSQKQKRSVINASLFDVFSVLMTNYDNDYISRKAGDFRKVFYDLMHDNDFVRSITSALVR